MYSPAILLAKTMSAATSAAFEVAKIGQIKTLQVIGLADAETATLEWEDALTPGTFVPYYFNGAQPTFSATNNVVNVCSAGNFRVNKGESAAEVGVALIYVSY